MAGEVQFHEIHAEMVATVMTVSTESGMRVDVGDTLLVLESMKMEIPVLAERAGVVVDVGVAAGDVVQEGDLLVRVDAGTAPAASPGKG